MKNLLVLFLIGITGIGGILIWQLTSRSNQTSTVTDLPHSSQSVNIPEGWQTYTSEIHQYSISYPEIYALEPNGENSILLVKQADQPGQGPANFIYVSVVPKDQVESEGTIYNYNPDNFNKLQELKVGQSIVLSPPDQAEWFTYTRIDTVEIDGHQARVYENTKPWEFPSGTTELRYIIGANEGSYILGYYYGGDAVSATIDPLEAKRILSTFQLPK